MELEQRISIIIPAYNEERYLAACLDAIAAQTVAPYEVIVVDNNSTDRTAEIARSYSFVTVLDEPLQGRSHAQDTGFRYATGNVLGRIDADARLHPDWVETVLACLGDADAITGRGYFYDMPLKKLCSWLQVALYQTLQKPIGGTYFLWGANMAVRCDAWQLVHAEVLKYPHLDEDIIASLLLGKQDKKIAYEPKLQVDASLRRNQLGPWEIAVYMSTWPRDYWVCGMHIRASIIGVVTFLVVLLALPVSLLIECAKLLSSRGR